VKCRRSYVSGSRLVSLPARLVERVEDTASQNGEGNAQREYRRELVSAYHKVGDEDLAADEDEQDSQRIFDIV
jgi:hypothetical protein